MDDIEKPVGLSLSILDAIEGALTYDYLQHRNPSQDTFAGIVRAHLQSNIDDVLVRRSIVGRLRAQLSLDEPIVLIGSPGSGKTSALVRLNRDLRSEAAATPGSRERLLVFNGNKNRPQLRKRKSLESKQDYIVDKFAAALEKRFFSGSSELGAFAEYLVSSVAEFKSFKTAFAGLTSKQISGALQADPDLQKLWIVAENEYENRESTEKLQPMIDVLTSAGVRLTLVIDNCDQLSNLDLEAAKAAVSELHSLSKHGMSLIVSLRQTTHARAMHAMNMIQYKVMFVNAFEESYESYSETPKAETKKILSEDLTDAFRIFDKRLKAFSNPSLVSKLYDHAESSGYIVDKKELRRQMKVDVSRIRRAADLVLNAYRVFDGATDDLEPVDLSVAGASLAVKGLPASDELEDITSAFLKWHNGSLRELARSFYSYLSWYVREDQFGKAEEEVQADLADAAALVVRETSGSVDLAVGLFSHRHVLSARTTLFRHLIFYQVPVNAVKHRAVAMHPCLQIFDVERPNTSKIEVPELRVLQYLHARSQKRAVTTFDQVGSALKRFGLGKKRVFPILAELALRQDYESGLIRADGLSPEDIQLNGGALPNKIAKSAEIFILPAGAYLVNRLVYTVEYLYWSAVSDPVSASAVSEVLGLPVEHLTSPSHFNRATRRVEVALVYVTHCLLPRFDQELELLDGGVTSRRQKRLKEYCVLFGFGNGDFFFSRILNQVEAYVQPRSGNGIILTDHARDSLKYLREVVRKLEFLYNAKV